MKRIIAMMIGLAAFSAALLADDKPISFDKLPSAVKVYVQTNFPDDRVSFVAKENDSANSGYMVILMNGTKMEFTRSGDLREISSDAGLPDSVIPVSIRNYVQGHYPGAGYVEFEIGKRTYEVKLTNRMELKFNNNFHLMSVDD